MTIFKITLWSEAGGWFPLIKKLAMVWNKIKDRRNNG